MQIKSWHLPVQSPYWKQENNVLKVNNKDIGTRSITSFWCLYCSGDFRVHLNKYMPDGFIKISSFYLDA